MKTNTPHLPKTNRPKPVDGAFGADSNRPAPETSQFRCNACGRYFQFSGRSHCHGE